MAKLNFTGTLKEAIIDMCEGNPGAAAAIINISPETEKVDPDNALGLIGFLMDLDSFEIYGSAIHVLYKYICEFDVTRTIAVVRAVQLGILDKKLLKDTCYGNYEDFTKINSREIHKKVCEQLPDFKKPEAEDGQKENF